MDRLRFWVSVAGLLLVAAGATTGFLVGRTWNTDAGATEETALIPEYTHSRWLLGSQEIGEELKLDAAQQKGIGDLLAAHRARELQLRGELQELASQANTELMKILNPEQRETLETIQEGYSVPYIEAHCIKELAILRREISLTQAQQVAVYQITYDSFKEQREIYKKHWESRKNGDGNSGENREGSREAFRQKMGEIMARRSQRLSAHLSEDQIIRYEEMMKERKKSWDRRHHKSRKHRKEDEKKEGTESPEVKGETRPGSEESADSSHFLHPQPSRWS